MIRVAGGGYGFRHRAHTFTPLMLAAVLSILARAFDVLIDLGLGDRANEHPYDLPLAERKLVTVAAALAQEARVLILDEPTQGLDAAARARVCDALAQAARDGVAVLGVTHDLVLVAARELGLELPEVARLAAALCLPGNPVRVGEVAGALQTRLGMRP